MTFGFSPQLVKIVAPQQAPGSLKPLLEFSGSDLLLQICSDGPLMLAHAQRVLRKDSRSLAVVKGL